MYASLSINLSFRLLSRRERKYKGTRSTKDMKLRKERQTKHIDDKQTCHASLIHLSVLRLACLLLFLLSISLRTICLTFCSQSAFILVIFCSASSLRATTALSLDCNDSTVASCTEHCSSARKHRLVNSVALLVCCVSCCS